MEVYRDYKTSIDINNNFSNNIDVTHIIKKKSKCTSYSLKNNNNEKNTEIVLDKKKEDEILELKDLIFVINKKTPDYILYNNRIFYKAKYYSKTINSETFFCKRRRHNEHLKNGLFCKAL